MRQFRVVNHFHKPKGTQIQGRDVRCFHLFIFHVGKRCNYCFAHISCFMSSSLATNVKVVRPCQNAEAQKLITRL